MRTFIAALMILGVGVSLASAEATNRWHRNTKVEKPSEWVCALIRIELRNYPNRRAAERAARERGYSTQEIQAGKLCL